MMRARLKLAQMTNEVSRSAIINVGYETGQPDEFHAPKGQQILAQGFSPGPRLWAILFCPFGARSDRWPRKQGYSKCFPT